MVTVMCCQVQLHSRHITTKSSDQCAASLAVAPHWLSCKWLLSKLLKLRMLRLLLPGIPTPLLLLLLAHEDSVVSAGLPPKQPSLQHVASSFRLAWGLPSKLHCSTVDKETAECSRCC